MYPPSSKSVKKPHTVSMPGKSESYSVGLCHLGPSGAPVIPAKAGSQCGDCEFQKICGVDSHFRGNDCGLQCPCLANDPSTGESGSWPLQESVQFVSIEKATHRYSWYRVSVRLATRPGAGRCPAERRLTSRGLYFCGRCLMLRDQAAVRGREATSGCRISRIWGSPLGERKPVESLWQLRGVEK